MGMKRSKRPIVFGLVMLASGLMACDETSSPSCDLEHLRQPSARFLVGDTYWLPAPAGACEGLRWELEVRPADSRADVVAGDDGYWRLTPDRPGTWSTRLVTQSFCIASTIGFISRSAARPSSHSCPFCTIRP